MTVESSKFLTIRETAKIGILSEYQLRMMHQQGRLPGIYSGTRFKVNLNLLMEQLDADSRKAVVHQ